MTYCYWCTRTSKWPEKTEGINIWVLTRPQRAMVIDPKDPHGASSHHCTAVAANSFLKSHFLKNFSRSPSRGRQWCNTLQPARCESRRRWAAACRVCRAARWRTRTRRSPPNSNRWPAFSSSPPCASRAELRGNAFWILIRNYDIWLEDSCRDIRIRYDDVSLHKRERFSSR